MLQMLAHGEAEPVRVAAEVGRATGAIIAEARASGSSALSAHGESQHPGAGMFLMVRMNRLVAAAEEAVAAARDGDNAGLSRHLRRFEALTSAIWTVQHAMCTPPRRVRHEQDSAIGA